MGYMRNYAGLVVLGLLNNIVYVVVITVAQTLAETFNEKKNFGNITWATNATGLLCRAGAVAMQRTPFKWRVLLVSFFAASGLVTVALATMVNSSHNVDPHLPDACHARLAADPHACDPNRWGFAVALIGIVLIGTAGNLGESVFLGYQKLYPSAVVGGWSMGTGLAGVGGSGLALALSGVPLRTIFLGCLPLVGIYVFTYGVVMQRPASGSASSSSLSLGSEEGLLSAQDEPLIAQPEEASEEELAAGESRSARFMRVLRSINWLALNMGLVYYFEYIISQGGANNAQPPGMVPRNWLERNAYEVLQVCYQVGVLISRSSLRYVKIHRVELLTLAQALSLALWLCQDKWHFLPLYAQVPLMVFVGLMGGASYVNIFYRILNDPPRKNGIQNRDRELACNISATYMNLGIILAGITTLVLDATIFKKD